MQSFARSPSRIARSLVLVSVPVAIATGGHAGGLVDVQFVGGTVTIQGSSQAGDVNDSASLTLPVGPQGLSASGSTGTGIVEWTALAGASLTADQLYLLSDLVLLSGVMTVEAPTTCPPSEGSCCSADSLGTLSLSLTSTRPFTIVSTGGQQGFDGETNQPVAPGTTFPAGTHFIWYPQIDAGDVAGVATSQIVSTLLIQANEPPGGTPFLTSTWGVDAWGSATADGWWYENYFLYESLVLVGTGGQTTGSSVMDIGLAEASATGEIVLEIVPAGASTEVRLNGWSSESSWSDCISVFASINLQTDETILVALSEPAYVSLHSDGGAFVYEISSVIDPSTGLHLEGLFGIDIGFTSSAYASIVFQPSGIAADLDGNGVVNGADLGVLLSQWGRCIGCPGDLNGDGAVDGSDLGLLLSHWG